MTINSQILTQLDTSEQQLLSLLDADVKEIFSTMVDMQVSTRPASSAEYSGFKNCLSAMICLSGRYNGVVSIHAPHPVAISITSHMLGMEVAEVDADVTDALGEIANMIGGSFKHHFVNAGHEVRLTPPTVIASNPNFRPPGAADMLTLAFDAEGGRFLVTVLLEIWD
jgi:chemotaxis protein CheX